MKKLSWLFILSLLTIFCLAAFYLLRDSRKFITGKPGETVELQFEMDRDFEYGEYYFDLENAPRTDVQLCFCLVEKNAFPPDCSGDVSYIYYNTKGQMCVPMRIGTGRCSAKEISSATYASVFYIPLEYKWGKATSKIVMGIKVPENIEAGEIVGVSLSFFRRNEKNEVVKYKTYEQFIKAKPYN